MVDIEELSEDKSSQGALTYIVEFVFPKDTEILLSFFEYNGIEDFMSFDAINVNQSYSSLEKPNI
jgi:hypothetical protein